MFLSNGRGNDNLYLMKSKLYQYPTAWIDAHIWTNHSQLGGRVNPNRIFARAKQKILVSFHSNNKTKTIEWPYLWIVACCYPIFQFFLVQYLIILLSIDLARKLAEKNYFASIFHSKEYKMVCVNWYQN